MYPPARSPTTVVPMRQHSALRKRGLGQSLSDLLDVASVAIGSGGSPSDVLSSITGEASDLLAPSQPYTVTPSASPVSLPVILGGVAVVGGVIYFVTRKKRGGGGTSGAGT